MSKYVVGDKLRLRVLRETVYETHGRPGSERETIKVVTIIADNSSKPGRDGRDRYLVREGKDRLHRLYFALDGSWHLRHGYPRPAHWLVMEIERVSGGKRRHASATTTTKRRGLSKDIAEVRSLLRGR